MNSGGVIVSIFLSVLTPVMTDDPSGRSPEGVEISCLANSQVASVETGHVVFVTPEYRYMYRWEDLVWACSL